MLDGALPAGGAQEDHARELHARRVGLRGDADHLLRVDALVEALEGGVVPGLDSEVELREARRAQAIELLGVRTWRDCGEA